MIDAAASGVRSRAITHLGSTAVAQTKKKRRKKHKGTQGGSIDRRGRGGRPQSREQARAQARRRSEAKRAGPPTWQSAIVRGLVAAGIFLALLVLLFGQPFGQSFALSGLMLLVYIPMGHFIDSFFYRRRRAKELKAKRERKQKGR
jgi:hypothetical protein